MKINKFLKKYFTNKYHGIYRHAKKLFVFDIILLTLAISLLGSTIFWFFWQPSIASKVEINFAYSREEFISGEEIELYLDYKNNSKLDLNETVLSLHFPDGFLLNKEKNPQISGTNSIELGKIMPGGNGKLTISGKLVGNTTGVDNILATLSYKIGKTNKIDQKSELSLIKYSSSFITAELNMQKTVFPDKEVPFSIKLANLSEETLENIYLQLPSFFGYIQKTLSFEPRQEIIIEGIAKIPKTLGELPFSYNVLLGFNGKKFVQYAENTVLEVLSPNINIKITPQQIYSYLESGETLKINLDFQNMSGNLMQNQVLTLIDVNNAIDLPKTAALNNIRENGQGLILDRNFRSVFQNGSMVKSDDFVLTLVLKDDAGASAPALRLQSQFSADLFGSDINFSILGDDLEIPIASLVQITAYPRYYTRSGDQIGRGSLPPQIDQATKYWIYIDVQNGANELTNFKLTATPGKNTTFTGKQSVSYGHEISFEENKVLWQKDSVSTSTSFGLYFELETVPEKNDLGKNLELMKEIKIEAMDKFSGKKYEFEFKRITNELQSVDKGSEMGSEVVR